MSSKSLVDSGLADAAWKIYCKDTAGGANVADFWHELSVEIQHAYLVRAASDEETRNAEAAAGRRQARVDSGLTTYPDNNPKTVYGEAKPKMSDTPTISIQMLGQVHTMGAEKYGPFNWRDNTVSSTVYYDSAMRHLMAYFDGQTLDPESNLPHLAHVMACCSILLDGTDRGSLNDNRPTPKDTL